MKIYTFFNKQRKRADGEIPVYICISRPPKRLYIHTGLFSKTEFLDGIFPRSESNHKAKTILLNRYIDQIEEIVLQNPLLQQSKLKELITSKVLGKTNMENSLSDYILNYSKMCKAKRTQELYIATANKVKKYDSSATLEITVGWIEKFEHSMRKEGLKTNSLSIHLRNIRTVINWANKHELTNNYPFSRFSIPTEETRKRNLPVESIRHILTTMQLSQRQCKYRDLFALMFYLIGINGVDLLNATPEQIKDGRLEYRRSKTGKLYSVKLEPEAKEIIEKYRGKGHLLSFCDKSQYRIVMMKMNNNLKVFGKDITTYYTRHTWATIAASLDIPMETIAAALGHTNGFKITSIYVDFNQKKVDEANRRVIDYVLYDKK